MGRCQKGVLPTHKKWLKIQYPNIIEKGVCDNANVIHAWNRFRTSLGKENWYRNHFSLPNEHREFFEDFLILICERQLKFCSPFIDYKMV